MKLSGDKKEAFIFMYQKSRLLKSKYLPIKKKKRNEDLRTEISRPLSNQR